MKIDNIDVVFYIKVHWLKLIFKNVLKNILHIQDQHLTIQELSDDVDEFESHDIVIK